MPELYNELYAVDDEDIVELFDLIAPGGTLHVHNVRVFATRPLVVTGNTRTLDMHKCQFFYWGDRWPFIIIKDTLPHRITYCQFHANTERAQTSTPGMFEQEYKDLDAEHGDPYEEDQ